MNAEKYLEKLQNLKGKKVLLLGATGSIGSCVLDYLVKLNADVTIAARNIDKALNLIKKYDKPIAVKKLDISSIKSIDDFSNENINTCFDYVIENMGIYHQKSVKNDDGIEVHFATNCLGPYYFINKVKFKKLVFTSSLSITFTKLDLDNIMFDNKKDLTDIYSNSKKVITYSLVGLKDKYDISIVHPGVSATNIFNGFNKLFKILVFPLVKLIFNKPNIAALSIIAGIYENTNKDEWIGPKRLFKTKGFPHVYKLPKQFNDEELSKKVSKQLDSILEGIKNEK